MDSYTAGDLMVQQVKEEKDIRVVIDDSLEFHIYTSEKVKKLIPCWQYLEEH